MKTKIIYISGSEMFEMTEVRAAFDEVRSALGLGRDTVLFGVPVDNDDALAPSTNKIEQAQEVAQPTIITTDEYIETPTCDYTKGIVNSSDDTTDEIAPTPIITDVAEPEEPIATISETVEDVVEEPIVDEIPAPVKKSRGRPRKTVIADEVIEETNETTIAEPTQSEKVIPILSILAANNAPEHIESEIQSADEIDEVETIEDAPVSDTEETLSNDTDTDVSDTVETKEFEYNDDMIDDQAPEEPMEKTLEQLLESMKPLHEEHDEAIIMDDTDADIDAIDIESEDISPITDTDATLERLASEFANTEDKIATPAPTQSQGKIGKLKNILPFKKVRREDPGLMGDLFGWAGVAANDEDFTIPGFFTTAASKK